MVMMANVKIHGHSYKLSVTVIGVYRNRDNVKLEWLSILLT
jgi:6-pyruvoyl-tetrahydropterin synthase